MAKTKKNDPLKKSFEKIRNDLRRFIDLAQEGDEVSWINWLSSIAQKIETKCWERKGCGRTDCPAYQNPCGRCWIIAGTALAGDVQCDFARKYQSCKECEVYQGAIYQDPITEIEEYIIVLVHCLRYKNQQLKELATTDYLTDLYNRRFFDSYIHHEYEQIRRGKPPVTLMMIDINGFKEINDQHGHVVGDRILGECAQLITKTTRQSDLVARYGGDEFVVILHESRDRQDYAATFIARIEELVSARNAAICQGMPVISLSYGHALLDKEKSIAQALAEADSNMYHDKKTKKNKWLNKK